MRRDEMRRAERVACANEPVSNEAVIETSSYVSAPDDYLAS